MRVRALPSLNLKKKRDCSQSTPSRVFLSPSKLRFGPQELNFSEIYLWYIWHFKKAEIIATNFEITQRLLILTFSLPSLFFGTATEMAVGYFTV